MNIMSHERIEKSVVILGILTFFAVIWGGLVQIVPLFFDNQLRPENSYVKPYDPLRLAGFNIYVREGCYGCHSQMIRPFRWETERRRRIHVRPPLHVGFQTHRPGSRPRGRQIRR